MRYSVRDYLQEKFERKDFINSEFSKTSESVFSYAINFPMTPKMLMRIQKGVKPTKALHITTLSSLPQISKLQNTSKTLSTYNRVGPNMLNAVDTFTDSTLHRSMHDSPAELNMPIILVLEGIPAIDFKMDTFSFVDEQGRRWVELNMIYSLSTADLNNKDKISKDKKSKTKIAGDVTKLRDKILKKYAKEIERSLPSHISYSPTWHNMSKLDDKKLKAKIIKEYMDGLEKIFQNHIKDFTSTKNQKVSSYNEIILSHFKIKKIYVTTSDTSDELNGELTPIDIDVMKSKYSKYAPVEYIGKDLSKLNKYLK